MVLCCSCIPVGVQHTTSITFRHTRHETGHCEYTIVLIWHFVSCFYQYVKTVFRFSDRNWMIQYWLNSYSFELNMYTMIRKDSHFLCEWLDWFAIRSTAIQWTLIVPDPLIAVYVLLALLCIIYVNTICLCKLRDAA